ncbi:MAG: recombinase family protein [Thermaerobacter sp.]|nr:recombinase family protein [Thermaerobacter sp.]
MRVATYARVSTEDQAQHGTSLEAQARICRERALQIGATEVRAFEDAGISGTSLDRPGLQALLKASAEGELDAVICLDPDRLARNLAHQLILTDRLESRGVDLHFVQFERARTPDGRLLYAIRGAIAEFEAHKIRERTLQGKRQRLSEGRVVTGTRIFGYTYDRTRHRFLEDPAEAAVVRAIFSLAPHLSTQAIAENLSATGLRGKNGGPLRQSAVHGVLRNPSYLGEMPQLHGLGRVAVPRIIDQDTFDAAQAALSRRRRKPKGHGRVYLLTGIAYCAACGSRITGSGGSRRYYACTGKRKTPRCSAPYYPAEELEAAVWAKVASELQAAARVLAKQPAVADTPRREARELRRLETQRKRLMQTAAAGRLRAQDLAGSLDALAAREHALQLAVRQAVRGVPSDRLLRLLAAGSPDLRRRILQAAGVRVVVGPEAAEISLRPLSAQ